MALSQNTKAPNFKARLHTGEEFELSRANTKYTVLYFYPKDNTPGCTVQACAIRDNKSEVEKYGAKIYGISKDSLKKHINFSEKFNLNFPLIVDENAEICNLYDVIKEKSMFGKKYMGIERTTYIIDSNQTIVAVMEKVNPITHMSEVIKILQELS